MEKKQIAGIIFDLDGTLINSLQDIAESVNIILAMMSKPEHTIEAYRTFVGNGLYRLIKKALPSHTEEQIVREGVAEFKRIYSERWNYKTKPYTGIKQLLEKLSENNIEMAILSNKPHAFTTDCAQYFFPENYFGSIQGQQETVKTKPHPEGALKILNFLGQPPEACLFVGDSDVDIKTGIAAGMIAVGVTWGFRTEKELRDSGAQIIIHQPEELLDYVRISH